MLARLIQLYEKSFSKYRFARIFTFDSTAIPYILLKAFCLISFFLPYMFFNILNVIIETILFIPNSIPIICIISSLVNLLTTIVIAGLRNLFFFLLLPVEDISNPL